MSDKENEVYIPLLIAFAKEFNKINYENSETTSALIKYLLGSNGKDYYKLIHNNSHTTTVIPFNFYKTLNKSASGKQPEISIPVVELPTRIIELDFK